MKKNKFDLIGIIAISLILIGGISFGLQLEKNIKMQQNVATAQER